MVQLILKNKIEKSKLDALLYFLKSWDIDAELVAPVISGKKHKEFTLAAGIWKDYDINAAALRKQAWSRHS